jgi:ubiquinone/menaquinone biosynthesis C-methylase UbiE
MPKTPEFKPKRAPAKPASKPYTGNPSASAHKDLARPAQTSWGGVAEWYDNYLETNKDSYQEMVIAPNLLRILGLKKGTRVLDIACGQGFFSRKFASAGATVVGADISKELVEQARKRSPIGAPQAIPFYATPAHKLHFAQGESFDVATIMLAIQNIENAQEALSEAFRVLAPGGRLVLVMNHPAFRVMKRSSWGFDDKGKTQYRRVDGYLSASTSTILMHPGRTEQKASEATISYHRSLQDFFKMLSKSGFVISRLEEWISHKKSEAGPRQKAEDTARKEIPLFLMLEATKPVTAAGKPGKGTILKK